MMLVTFVTKGGRSFDQGLSREGVVIARWGGDEFILFYPEPQRKREKLRIEVKNQFAQEWINNLPGSMSLGCNTKNTTTERSSPNHAKCGRTDVPGKSDR